MCELFGVCADGPQTINAYLKEFYSHSERHPHGWGLALLDEGTAIEKEPILANDSFYLKSRLMEEITASCALGHIRDATRGKTSYNNCHPFTGKDVSGRRWTLIHNGTIFSYWPMERFEALQKGQTDSERLLLYLLDCMNAAIEKKGAALTGRERFEVMDREVTALSRGNKVNLLVYDGECMYAHTNLKGTLYYLEKKQALFFSTTALSDEDWKPVPFMQVIACEKGKMVRFGTPHRNEYFKKPGGVARVMKAAGSLFA